MVRSMEVGDFRSGSFSQDQLEHAAAAQEIAGERQRTQIRVTEESIFLSSTRNNNTYAFNSSAGLTTIAFLLCISI